MSSQGLQASLPLDDRQVLLRLHSGILSGCHAVEVTAAVGECVVVLRGTRHGHAVLSESLGGCVDRRPIGRSVVLTAAAKVPGAPLRAVPPSPSRSALGGVVCAAADTLDRARHRARLSVCESSYGVVDSRHATVKRSRQE